MKLTWIISIDDSEFTSVERYKLLSVPIESTQM